MVMRHAREYNGPAAAGNQSYESYVFGLMSCGVQVSCVMAIADIALPLTSGSLPWQNAERRTQNAERRTQNAERRTQNAERRTQNAERR